MDVDNFLILTNPLIPSISSYIHQIETNTNSQSNHSLPHEITLTIRHPKVVQKSYKNEKRFFCPSPSMKIGGLGWKNWEHFYSFSQQPTSGKEASNYNKHSVKMFPQCVALVDAWPEHGHATQLKNYYASFKSLFFSDKDKRKIFQLEIKIFLTPNIALGTFLSNQIRVISKPSKKKQTGARNDKLNIPISLVNLHGNQFGSTFQQPSSSYHETLPMHSEQKFLDPACISSGSEIAIFNRGRSQAIATRYLSTNQNGAYEATTNFWEIFTIDLVSSDVTDTNLEYESIEGYITYGCYARLTSENGITLPTLKLERIEKQKLTAPTEREPLGQLQKVAFQVVSTGQYLAFNESQVVQVSCINPESNDRIVPDSAALTVVAVEEAVYTFHPLLFNPIPPPVIFGPCPTILQVGSTFTRGNNLFLELCGSNLTPNLLVFFSTIPTMTFYRSSELIFCLVPSFKQFVSSNNPMPIFDIPLYLWKKDGILYQTEQKYVYFLAEHIALDQRNQAIYPHSTVTMQPDLLNECQIPTEIGTETNKFGTDHLFVSKNDFGIETNGLPTSDFLIGTNEITFRQSEFQTGTNNISVSSDGFVNESDRVCPSNTFGTETNHLSVPENRFIIPKSTSNENICCLLTDTSFHENYFEIENNGIYVNSCIQSETIPLSTNQYGTNSCTYMSHDFPNSTFNVGNLIDPESSLTESIIRNSVFETGTNEFPEELEPTIHPFDSTLEIGTLPPISNINLLQTGTKRRIGTNEGVGVKLFRPDDTFSESHYHLKTDTNTKE